MARRKRSLEEELRDLKAERLVKELAGTLPREIQRQHRFPVNEHPLDNDAHPDSGWLYVKEWDYSSPGPTGPLIVPKRGPESGIPCQTPGCGQPTYIVDELHPGDILSYVGENGGEKRVLIKNPDGIAILMCHNDHEMQWRVSHLPSAFARLVLP